MPSSSSAGVSAALKLRFTAKVFNEFGSCGKLESEMSGQTVPADFSEHMLDLDEDDDLEVFSKVKRHRTKNRATTSDSLLPIGPVAFLATWI